MSRTFTKIIITQKDGTVVGQYYLGQGEHLIGREIDSAIYIDDTSVSHEHARLIISAEAIEIEDLDSTSGTYLDGVTVKGRIPIQPGQKLWISDLYIDIERQGFGGLVEGSRLGDGRFTLKRELGKGGMGAVWLALDEETQENFAIKLVSGEISLDPKSLKDLQREVNKAHKLVHPNIVEMGYFWKEEGEPAFISLEYVDGTDLDQVRSDSPHGLLAWEEVQRYMIQLCDALEYAHSQKVAHRDIKPSNFMINSEGNLKLADFGIAASLTNTSMSFTASSVLGTGTPPYMSPQQLDGERPQITDDIYSVGATFYDLLTSTPPFHQGDIGYQVRHAEATPMVEHLKELELRNIIPEHVSAIVMACLQKDPGKRPQSMRVIREWIQEAEEAAEAETVAPVAARETQVLEAAPSTATTEKAPAGGIRKKTASPDVANTVTSGVVGGIIIGTYSSIFLSGSFWPIVAGFLFTIIFFVWKFGSNPQNVFNPQNVLVEKAIRQQISKPTGELTTADLENLEELGFQGMRITDKGLKGLAKLTQVTKLYLWRTQITDAGLKEVAKLSKLTMLDLRETQITDTGLKEVAKLENLKEVWLHGAKITYVGRAQLQKALPKCKISHDLY